MIQSQTKVHEVLPEFTDGQRDFFVYRRTAAIFEWNSLAVPTKEVECFSHKFAPLQMARTKLHVQLQLPISSGYQFSNGGILV